MTRSSGRRPATWLQTKTARSSVGTIFPSRIFVMMDRSIPVRSDRVLSLRPFALIRSASFVSFVFMTRDWHNFECSSSTSANNIHSARQGLDFGLGEAHKRNCKEMARSLATVAGRFGGGFRPGSFDPPQRTDPLYHNRFFVQLKNLPPASEASNIRRIRKLRCPCG